MVNRIARLLREHGAVEHGDFTLASGAKSPYYLDVKSALTHPDVLTAVGEEIARIGSFDTVAGVAVGASPLRSWYRSPAKNRMRSSGAPERRTGRVA